MAVYLIRHGETASNASRVVQTPDTPLSAHGLRQADRLAARLAGSGVARILTSDLPRAAMTAERLAAATGAPVVVDALLRERDFGDVRGTRYSELPADIFAPGYVPPAGESWEVFDARVDDAWALVERTAAATAGHLAVVTHGLVCHSIARRRVELPPGAALPARWENTALTVVEGPPWRVRLLACAAHLDERGEGTPA